MSRTTTVTTTLRRQRGLTEPAALAAIDQACRRLRLPTIRAVLDEALAAANREQLSYQGFLAELLLAECDDRDRRSTIRRVKAAGFPRQKWLGDFDFDANPNINPATIHQLATGDWISKGQPLCLIGDSGTGKSHLLIALGTAAAERGFRVRYTLATRLVNELVEAADDKQLTKTINRYGRVDLLLLDELGYMELDKRGAELLFQVLTEREERTPSPSPAMRPSRAGQKPLPTRGSAQPLSTDLPSAAPSLKPAPTPTGWPTPATRKLRQPAEPGGARGSHRTGRPAARPSVDQANGLAS
ncbi:hypothetical protein MAGR_63400 [Mycolicibacterium agri]|uniref:IstB-like ATP-binding domain-containing protein n=2 Tax=Mycolicibacterium agri TaxID=36811 RepID=A0A7I9WBV9_MYCAG|nr:hypothetical protein MAGR_63400 [Mycolicibacterium agri]